MKRTALAAGILALLTGVAIVLASPHAASKPRQVTAGHPRVEASRPVAPPRPRPPRRTPSRSVLLLRRASMQGSLPQTRVYPSGRTATIRALMGALWRGIVLGSGGPALPAFFPKAAYEQLKAIGGAGSDWTNRLVHDFTLDVRAAHDLLAGEAGRARLLSVHVPASFGHWVPPGVCDNGIGYFEVPNARIVYSLNGRTRSFGIASMISWRGVWYVVHLGAILRTTDTGQVDAPSSGAGKSEYSGTC
jgi:hypothetical protein